jgi:hypothetical protein
MDWAKLEHMPLFNRRWRDRAAALGRPASAGNPPRVAIFPEAVALAAILTNLTWRRHVALEWDVKPFYQRIAASIGEESYPYWPYHNDPVRRWARTHRSRFARLSALSWGQPPPPAERFK